MLLSPRHSRHSLAIALLLASSIVSCTSLHHRPFERGTDLEDVSGVTTRSGAEIPFAKSSATIKNDTLYALGEHGPLKMPTDSIARVSKRKVSVWRTAALTVGIGAAAIVALGVAFLATLDFNQT
jgi:hypothetical protein